MRLLAAGLLVLALGGCAEVHIVCRGKGIIAVGPYAGSGDCGDGFEYHRTAVPFKPDDMPFIPKPGSPMPTR